MSLNMDIAILDKTWQAEITTCQVCAFLGRYSAVLFQSGSTCIRLEKNVTRIAETFGRKIEFTVLPRHIHLTVRGPEPGDVATEIVTIGPGPISFELNTELSKLSWDIADGKLSFAEAEAEFDRLVTTKTPDIFNLPFIVACANAAFCRLFDGDMVAMAVVFVAVYVGYIVKIWLSRLEVDYRLTVICCAFVSTLLTGMSVLLNLGSTPGVAVATGVLYLVPGIPYINSFSDMLDRHYICAFGRLMKALVLTACLSIGIGLGVMVLRIPMF